MARKKLISSTLLAAVLLITGCREGNGQIFQTDVFAMDTFMTVKLSGGRGEETLVRSKEELLRLEKLFDVNDEDSDVYRINHHPGESVSVDKDTAALVQKALEYGTMTGGALDISIYPVVREWGFTTGSYHIPGSKRLSELLKQVDYRQIKVDTETGTVTVPKDVMLDLGAVAKGFAGDRVRDILHKDGVTSGLINLGGNVAAVGSKPDGSPWRVGIRDPRQEDGTIGTLLVRDQAVITSGTYERYFVGEDGNAYWHILDPKTGFPSDGGLASVTIVGDNGLMCDALSTALFVMGKDGAIEFCRKETSVEVILIDGDNHVYYTPGLQEKLELAEGISADLINRKKQS